MLVWLLTFSNFSFIQKDQKTFIFLKSWSCRPPGRLSAARSWIKSLKLYSTKKHFLYARMVVLCYGARCPTVHPSAISCDRNSSYSICRISLKLHTFISPKCSLLKGWIFLRAFISRVIALCNFPPLQIHRISWSQLLHTIYNMKLCEASLT